VALETLWCCSGMQTLIAKPQKTGIALVCWLMRHARELVQPSVRAEVEAACAAIARGGETASIIKYRKLSEHRCQYQALRDDVLAPGSPAIKELIDMLTLRSFEDLACLTQDAGALNLPALEQRSPNMGGSTPVGGVPQGLCARQLLLQHSRLCLHGKDGQPHVKHAADLQPGDELLSDGDTAVSVQRCCLSRELHLAVISVRIRAQGSEVDETLIFTANQGLATKRRSTFPFLVVAACQLRQGDMVQTLLGEAQVLGMQSEVRTSEVLELTLGDLGSSFYVQAGVTATTAVKLFGELEADSNPLERVKLLQLDASAKEQVIRSTIANKCWEDIEDSDLGPELQRCGIDRGQALVRPEVARQLCFWLSRIGRCPLPKTHCIVGMVQECSDPGLCGPDPQVVAFAFLECQLQASPEAESLVVEA